MLLTLTRVLHFYVMWYVIVHFNFFLNVKLYFDSLKIDQLLHTG